MSIIHSSSANHARQPELRPTALKTKNTGIADPQQETVNNSKDPAFGLLVNQLLGVAAADAQPKVSHDPGADAANSSEENVGTAPAPPAQPQPAIPSDPSAETVNTANTLLGVALTSERNGNSSAVTPATQGSGQASDKTGTSPVPAAVPAPLPGIVQDKTALNADQDSDTEQSGQTPQAGRQPVATAGSHGRGGKSEHNVQSDPEAPDMSVLMKMPKTEERAADSVNQQGHQTSDDNANAIFSLSAPAEDGASGGVVGLEGKPGAKPSDEVGSLAANNGIAQGSMESASLVSRDPAVTRHIASAAGGPGGLEGASSLRAHATDPAEQFDRTVSIIRDGSRLAVKLEPDGLGKLEIDLRLNKGVVTAQIQVADEAARKVIEHNAQQIVDALIKEGLTVGGFSVSLKGGGAWNGPAENARQYENARKEPALQSVSAVERGPARGLVNLFV